VSSCPNVLSWQPLTGILRGRAAYGCKPSMEETRTINSDVYDSFVRYVMLRDYVRSSD
jgi:hypothetical protein